MRLRTSVLAVLALAVSLVAPAVTQASLTLLRPDPLVSGTFYGHGGLSTDGWGGSGSGTVQAEIPAGSAIYKAWLYSAGTPGSAQPTTIAFGGSTVSVSTISNDTSGTVTRGEVTDLVSAALTSEGGTYSFAVTKPSGPQGVALAVIYTNPDEPNRTIAILDGGALPTGDSATFSFASPLDTSISGFEATLALGISFSYQGAVNSHACGSGQVSNVDINGTRLSSCAGSADDSTSTAGLITVGGVGDVIDNPPSATGPGGNDDELYDLVPLLHDGDTSLTVATINPSHDDYIFLAGITITARASVASTGSPTITSIDDQGIVQDTDTGALGFTVGDAETAAAALAVTGASSNHTLVPDANIVFGGSGASRTVTVTPASGQTGSATIALTVTDGDGKTSLTSFLLTVDAPPPPSGPTAVDDSATTDEDVTLDGTSVLANDMDPLGHGLTAVLVGGAAHGALSLAAGGTFTYTPDADYHGADSFTYQADDGDNLSNVATVSITVDSVTDAAVCTGGTLDVDEDSSVDGTVTCTSIDGGTPSIDITSPAAAHGSVTAIDHTTGAFTYTPDHDYSGPDTVWFSASLDGAPDSAKVAFAITVHGVNDDPHAVDDTADAAQSDDPVAISIDVLANDTDVDGDALALVGVSTPDHGTATVEANHILFTPEAGFVGDATFTYTVEDESEASDTATVTVTVAPDVSGPTVLAPTQTILAPAVPTRSSVMVRFSWPVGSDISGVASYEAQLSTDDGPWVDVSGPSMTRQLDGMLVVSHVYRLRVRATDGLGNVSAWKQGPRFGVKAWQTPAFTYKKHWTIVEATSSTGTGFRYSTVKGAKATISGEGRSFAWVAPKNAKSGKAKVYVDGHYVATINLHASTSVARRVVWSITFASVGEHRVTIVNQGTHGHSRVSLDALVVLR